ncbi:hypothetical protein SARC_10052 [Sphaeroforma arctica JP610]|uniref:Helicase C-terminal domain-containing protein n=1 Tax=Sphaeroforma arctica JP610 TaxID=667725 RepID=A0A0L0FL29_9EUKA|nr:hypothetical protein SARC_10052 [Sphaeroforma arctica JP610]KNC77489.1 hypothetical protein SARC_10052 [Sphaeroforma arctica JP610]|eukprot:XP_014151391.1 hypothetical protein SARC_10052 [Sphaeroforma arctica JP610]
METKSTAMEEDMMTDVIMGTIEVRATMVIMVGEKNIIMAEQRVVAHIVQWYIEQDATLRSSVNVRSGIVYATSTPATASLRVTNSDSKGRMDKFRNGELNILVSTSVSEEGMDVPAANCVIRFDAVQTPVSLVQSRGRARQKDSNFVVLAESTQANRTVACIQEADHRQYNLVTATPFDKSTTNTQASRKRRTEANAQRQKRALAVLNSRLVVSVTPAYTELLNMYVAQCVGELAVSFDKVTFSKHRCAWVCDFVLLAWCTEMGSLGGSGFKTRCKDSGGTIDV